MGDIRALVVDPEFQQLDLSTKKQVLSRADPSFKVLSDDELSSFLSKANKGPSAPEQPRTFGGDFMTRIGDNIVNLAAPLEDPVGTAKSMLTTGAKAMFSPYLTVKDAVQQAARQSAGENAADLTFNLGAAALGGLGGETVNALRSGGLKTLVGIARHPVRTIGGIALEALQGPEAAAAAAPKRFSAGAPPRPGSVMFPEPVAPEPIPAMGYKVSAPPRPTVPTEVEPIRAMGKAPAPPAPGTRQQPAPPEPVRAMASGEKPPTPKPIKIEVPDKFTVPKPTMPKPVEESVMGPAPIPEHPVTGKVEVAKPTPIESVHEDYMKHAGEFAATGAKNAFNADAKLATSLKSKGITPEAWLNATEDIQDAHAKEVGQRAFGNRGTNSRRRALAIKQVYDRLSEQWGR